PGFHRQPDDQGARRETARRDPRLDTDRAPGVGQGDWRRGGLSGEFRSGLLDRTDAPCERRNGNDLRILESPKNGGARGLALLSRWRRRYAIDPVCRGAREGRINEASASANPNEPVAALKARRGRLDGDRRREKVDRELIRKSGGA